MRTAFFIAAQNDAFGPSRHFAPTQRFGRFRGEADMKRQTRLAEWVENCPYATSVSDSL